MTYCDSHIHLARCSSLVFPSETCLAVSSCHTREDFEALSSASLRDSRFGSGVPQFAHAQPLPSLSLSPVAGFAAASYPCAFASFGIHPQAVSSAFMESSFSRDLAFLESLLREQKIVAIGECGFDFFTVEYKATATNQKIAFESQLSLAQEFQIPLVLHLRKAIEKIFSYSKELKKVPAVIFHSFPGTLREASSLMNHGINAFFSFGKPILNGKKSAIDCVKNLPLENLLFETDAPYQTLKGESETLPCEIERVYHAAASLRSISEEELSAHIEANFRAAFNLSY